MKSIRPSLSHVSLGTCGGLMLPVVEQGGVTHLYPSFCFIEVLKTTPRDIPSVCPPSFNTYIYTILYLQKQNKPQASKFGFTLCKFEIVLLPSNKLKKWVSVYLPSDGHH